MGGTKRVSLLSSSLFPEPPRSIPRLQQTKPPLFDRCLACRSREGRYAVILPAFVAATVAGILNSTCSDKPIRRPRRLTHDAQRGEVQRGSRDRVEALCSCSELGDRRGVVWRAEGGVLGGHWPPATPLRLSGASARIALSGGVLQSPPVWQLCGPFLPFGCDISVVLGILDTPL